MPVDQQFNTINDKLQQLLKQYNRLQKENERLKKRSISTLGKLINAFHF
jgi:cell shape-determining protein MreC